MKQLLAVLFAAMFAAASVSAFAQDKKADPMEKEAMKDDKSKKAKAKPKAKATKKKSDDMKDTKK
jgi:hypothetical protein